MIIIKGNNSNSNDHNHTMNNTTRPPLAPPLRQDGLGAVLLPPLALLPLRLGLRGRQEEPPSGKQRDPRPDKNSLIRKRCCRRRMDSLIRRRFLSYSGIVLRVRVSLLASEPLLLPPPRELAAEVRPRRPREFHELGFWRRSACFFVRIRRLRKSPQILVGRFTRGNLHKTSAKTAQTKKTKKESWLAK